MLKEFNCCGVYQYHTHTSDGKIKVSSLSLLLFSVDVTTFHIQSKLGVSLFEKYLCANRWTNVGGRRNKHLSNDWHQR